MVEVIDQARQNISQARETAEVERQKNVQAQAAIDKLRSNLNSTSNLRRKTGIEGLRQRQMAERELSTSEGNLSQRQEAIERFEDDLVSVERDIQKVEQTQSDYDQALRAFTSSDAEAVFSLENPQQKEFYRQLQEDKQSSVEATLRNLKKQGVTDSAVLTEIEAELQQNLGKVSSFRINQRINTLANAQQEFKTLEMPAVGVTGQINTLSSIKAETIEPVSNFSKQPFTVRDATRFEKFQGFARDFGVSIPTGVNIAETVFTGRTGDERLGQVTGTEFVEAPLKAVQTFSEIAGGAAEASAKKLGITGIRTEVPAFDVGLRQTAVPGLELGRGGTVIPSFETTSFNPEQIGKLAQTATFGAVSSLNNPILVATSIGAVSEGWRNTFDNTRTPTQRGLAALELGLGIYGAKVGAVNPLFRVRPTFTAGGQGGVAKYSVFADDGSEFIITQADRTNTFEIIKPLKDSAGNQLTSSSFFIRRDAPPVVEYANEGLFFRAEETIKNAPRSEIVSSNNILSNAATGAIVNRPTFLGKGRDLGGGNPTEVLGELSGGSVSVKSIKELPKEQQEIFLDMFESQTGRRISADVFDQTFKNSNIQKSTGGINARVLSSFPETAIGKKITRSATSMDTRQMISNENAPFNIFRTRQGSKDVSLPFQNLDDIPKPTSGSEGVSIVFKEIKDEVAETGFGSVITKRPKTVLSKKVIDTINVAETAALDLLPRPKVPSVSVKADTLSPKPIIPGKSTFNQQMESRQSGTTSQILLPEVKAQSNERVDTIGLQAPRNIQANIPNMAVRQDSVSRQESNSRIETLSKNLLETNVKNIQNQQPKFLQFTPSASKSAFGTLPKQRTTSTNARPRPRRTPPPGINKLLDFFRNGGKLKPAIDGDGFEVFVRKNKQDISIGKVGSLSEASKKLTSSLKSTLRASGFITDTKTGTKVSLDNLGLGREFTRSKRDSKRTVQRRRFRLGSFGERSEIRSARRGKKSSKKRQRGFFTIFN